MTKKEIRSKYLQLRVELSSEKYASLNQELSVNFFSGIDLTKINTLHTFLPILLRNEVDTWLIIHQLKKDHPQIRISIPRVEDNRLVNYYLEGGSQLNKNQWGILEPASGEITPADKIDLVIVPLLAFDKKGNRVGYGKGFYDRFLIECRVDCKKIGLSFFEPIENISDINANDVRLDAVVTPTHTLTIN